MGIDVGRLEDELLQMSSEGRQDGSSARRLRSWPGRGRFAQLREVLPGIVYDELWMRYQQDAGAFVAGWRMLAQEMRQGFIQHARQRLTSLTQIATRWEAENQRRRGRRFSGRWTGSRTTCCARLLRWSCWSWWSRRCCGPRICGSAWWPRQFRGGRPLSGRGHALLFLWAVHGLRGDVPFGAGRSHQAEAARRADAAGAIRATATLRPWAICCMR